MSGLVWRPNGAIAKTDDGWQCEVFFSGRRWCASVFSPRRTERRGFSTEAEARAWCEALVKEGREA